MKMSDELAAQYLKTKSANGDDESIKELLLELSGDLSREAHGTTGLTNPKIRSLLNRYNNVWNATIRRLGKAGDVLQVDGFKVFWQERIEGLKEVRGEG